MAAPIPVQGKDLASLVIYGANMKSDGTFVKIDGTTAGWDSLGADWAGTGRFKELQFTYDPGLVSVLGTDAQVKNMVKTSYSVDMTLVELLQKDLYGFALLSAQSSYDYMKVIFKIASLAGGGSFKFLRGTYIGIIGPGSHGIVGPENTSSINLAPMDQGKNTGVQIAPLVIDFTTS